MNRLFTFTFFLLTTISLQAQPLEKLDSMRIALKDSSIEASIKWHYRIADRYYTKHELRDSQRINIYRGMELARSIKDTNNIAGGYLDLGYMEMKTDFSKADSFLNLSFDLHQASNNSRGLGMVHLARASLASKQGFSDQIIGHTIKAKAAFEKAGDQRGVVACLHNIAHSYAGVGQIPEALKYYYQAYELKAVYSVSQRSNLFHSIAVTHWNYYESSEDQTQLDSFLLRVKDGLALTEERKLLYWGLKFKLLDAAYDIHQKDFSKAIPKCKYVVEEARRINRKIPISDGFKNLAKAYQGLKKYDEALRYADSVIHYGVILNKDKNVRDGYEVKYELFKEMGRNRLALENLEQFKFINDTLNRVEGVAKLKEIEQKYESAKQEKEILALNKESETLRQNTLLKQQEIKSKNYLLLALGLLMISAITFIYVFYQRKILKEKKRAEEIQQQLWRSQMNPHFLFNALNSIQRFYVEGNTEKGNEFLADFGDLLRKILERSTKSMVSITEEVEFLKLYIDLEKRRLDKPLDYSIELSEDLKDYEYLIPALLIQPIVENAIRHGIAKSEDAGKMEIKILKTNQGIQVNVIDNGIGFTKSKIQSKSIHQSMGLELVKERINKIGDFSIEEIKDDGGTVKGTEVQIFINTDNN